ncbi:MAG: ATP-binding protein [Hyphomonadaceae bacterium]|nr:ATP-binding protein [Clostridia bacterium]
MLCQFTVENFKSIKDCLTLDMQASTAISEHSDKIIVDSDGEQFLPLAVIYGPNGGGKSNVIEALNNLIRKIMRPICAVCDKRGRNCSEDLKKSPTLPFKFSKESLNAPTKFELFFRTKLAEYKYNLTVKNDVVIYESLHKKNIEGTRHTPLFIRDIHLEKPCQLMGSLKKLVVSDLTETLTLLSYLAITHKKNPTVRDIIGWFESDIELFNYGSPLSEMRIGVSESDKIKMLILNMIREMDIDIDDYRVEDKEESNMKIFTKHVVHNKSFELDLFEESNGTIKLFGMLPFIATSLVLGSTLIIDELDAKLHPKLLKYIIELYRNVESNSNKAQLIFTSHDLSTMTSELFRRDEIWFVAKNNEQASTIYSLVEFKDKEGKSVRKDATLNKQYLEGRYGADPYLRKIINWEEI